VLAWSTRSRVQTRLEETDRLQRAIARLVATSPAGVNLLLIGGFRYRLLDNSQRFSVDIDYHWGGDLEAKQGELLRLCRRLILSQVRRELGYEGSASIRTGPDADSPSAKFIDLRFWKSDMHIEIPLEITRIVCLDPPTIRTAAGTVHATLSDADLIESKVIAVLNRLFLQHRDLVDIFLYRDNLLPDSPARLKGKLASLQLGPETIAARINDLRRHPEYHAVAIQKVIDEQMQATVAEQMNSAGGGRTVLESVLSVLLRVCPP
jgi:Nucleotidyl transferase AbiEii toxin, Type IV TA system